MDRKTALQIKAELIEYASKYGLWVDVHEAHRPVHETRSLEFKDIVLTISVRITKK